MKATIPVRSWLTHSGNRLEASFSRNFSASYTFGSLIRLMTIAIVFQTVPSAAAQSFETGDFEYFKTQVQPIFLKKRPGHARCVVCHGEGAAPGGFGLQPLNHGMTTWTDEQSRQNYQVAIRMIAPGDPTSSPLLLHPLSPLAGGDRFHNGGRQFESQNDPDWRVMAEWVKQAKAPAYSNLKVLDPSEVGRAMARFDVALGVACTFCHASSGGSGTDAASAWNFAADSNPMKELARRMIALNKQINTTAQVTCFTCHRGEAIPKRVPDPASPDY
jgi:hypothetical protein